MTSFASASASNDMHTSPWRPSVPSPLASSPIRPTSTFTSTSGEPPHTSRPDNDNDLDTSTSVFDQRATQSSPIQKPASRFASRPARPNPLVRKREDVQEQRRRNFLHSVRHKADERAWRRRDIEGQSLRTSWLANIGRLSHDAPVLSDVDIEDAVAHSQEAAQSAPSLGNGMLEVITEEDELESLVSAYEQQQQRSLPLPYEQEDEDDDDYDDLFAELILREPADRIGESPSTTDQGSSSAMDMTE